MNQKEIERGLRTLRCGGMADTLETRLVEAQSQKLAYIDFMSALVSGHNRPHEHSTGSHEFSSKKRKL